MKNIRDLFNKTAFLLTAAAVMTLAGCEEISDNENDKKNKDNYKPVVLDGENTFILEQVQLGMKGYRINQDQFTVNNPTVIDGYNYYGRVSLNDSCYRFSLDGRDGKEKNIDMHVRQVHPINEETDTYLGDRSLSNFAAINGKITAHEGTYIGYINDENLAIKEIQFKMDLYMNGKQDFDASFSYYTVSSLKSSPLYDEQFKSREEKMYYTTSSFADIFETLKETTDEVSLSVYKKSTKSYEKIDYTDIFQERRIIFENLMRDNDNDSIVFEYNKNNLSITNYYDRELSGVYVSPSGKKSLITYD